jgi:hypothetical protein
MFRAIVVLGNILAFIGVSICAFTHALSLIDVAPEFLVRAFAAALLAVLPLGGLATVLALRAGRTYDLWGGRLSAFIARRTPRWLRRVGIGVFVYALIHFVVFSATGLQENMTARHIPLMASAFVAWFYLMFIQLFTVGLSDPQLIGPAGASG